jgi:methionyl-tRNA formyltransferase
VDHAISVWQPRSLRLDGKYPQDAASAQAELLALQPQVMVVAAYGLILPDWVLRLPQLGCLNIHASLLPRWRGAAPIHRAIEAGDALTGVTIMQMDEGLDTGDMLLDATLALTPQETTATLHDRLAQLGGRLIAQVLAAAEAGTMPAARPQPREGICYAHKIAKEEATLDWSAPAQMLERRIRAFDPFPGALWMDGDAAVKVWRAEVLDRAGEPGQRLIERPSDEQELIVACGQGALRLLELQRPGGRRVSAAQYLQANRAR